MAVSQEELTRLQAVLRTLENKKAMAQGAVEQTEARLLEEFGTCDPEKLKTMLDELAIGIQALEKEIEVEVEVIRKAIAAAEAVA